MARYGKDARYFDAKFVIDLRALPRIAWVNEALDYYAANIGPLEELRHCPPGLVIFHVSDGHVGVQNILMGKGHPAATGPSRSWMLINTALSKTKHRGLWPLIRGRLMKAKAARYGRRT